MGIGVFRGSTGSSSFYGNQQTAGHKKSRIIATSWCVISLFSAVFIGIIGRKILAADPALASKSGAENILVVLSEKLLPGALVVFAGIIMAGILAATISSSDSYLLIASS